MTESDFILNGFDNRHCEFTFKDGKIITGVVSSFFIDEPHSFELVKTNDMIAFMKYSELNDRENMKKLSNWVDLENIDTVRLLG